ncbi:MAG: HNH endonuclease [Peptostreptococcaceae bacterium]
MFKTKKINNEYVVYDTYFELIIHSEKFGGYKFLLDLEDYDVTLSQNWCLVKIRSGEANRFYVGGRENGKTILLHRILTNCPKCMVVDHIDGDVFNNRRNNLRICTNKENIRKRGMSNNNTSGYKGVLWYPYNNYNKWKAYIKVNNKMVNLGYYSDIKDAVLARREAELRYYGEFAPNPSVIL